MALTRSELEVLYKSEEDLKVKERILFILRVEGDGAVPSRMTEEELHRSRPWASYWLDRHLKEGIEGPKDKTRTKEREATEAPSISRPGDKEGASRE
jgi:hypothetical protein